MKKQQGLSIVELGIALFVLSVLLVAGVPAFIEYMTNTRIRAVADEMHAGLQLARSEAISRNAAVDFMSNGTGWSVQLPAIGVGDPSILAIRAPKGTESSVVANSSAASIRFNGRGRAVGANNFNISVSALDPNNCIAVGGEIRCLNVLVSNAGQVRLCDPAIAANEPRGC